MSIKSFAEACSRTLATNPKSSWAKLVENVLMDVFIILDILCKDSNVEASNNGQNVRCKEQEACS